MAPCDIISVCFHSTGMLRMILNVMNLVCFVLLIWANSVAAVEMFYPVNQGENLSSSLMYTGALCRSRLDTAVLCSTMETGCRGLWVVGDRSRGMRCGVCHCATDFNHAVLSLGNPTLNLNKTMHLNLKVFESLPDGTSHEPRLQSQNLLPHYFFLYLPCSTPYTTLKTRCCKCQNKQHIYKILAKQFTRK